MMSFDRNCAEWFLCVKRVPCVDSPRFWHFQLYLGLWQAGIVIFAVYFFKFLPPLTQWTGLSFKKIADCRSKCRNSAYDAQRICRAPPTFFEAVAYAVLRSIVGTIVHVSCISIHYLVLTRKECSFVTVYSTIPWPVWPLRTLPLPSFPGQYCCTVP